MIYNKIKEDIKELSDNQRQLRKERKQSYVGERQFKYPTMKHALNRYKLRHLFAAYAYIRGKEIIKPKRASFSEELVTKIICDYITQDIKDKHSGVQSVGLDGMAHNHSGVGSSPTPATRSFLGEGRPQ